MKNLTFVFLVAFLGLCLQNCSMGNQAKASAFDIESSTYQNWRVSETEMGSTIEIELSNVGESVDFSHLIFQRQKVSVQQINQENGKVLLKALVQRGKAIVENSGQTIVNKPDQLIYSVDGKTTYIQLTDWQRKPTQLK